MGGGTYSSDMRSSSGRTAAFSAQSVQQTFKERSMNNAMSPYGLTKRESRDSEEHPNSVPIIIGLDVTGSMGSVPAHMVKEGLPNMMDTIIKKGLADPQVLFLGIGDHECDTAPLQVGQFESSDELLDHWLTKVYLESGGGGNSGESYHLAWYLAGRHTEHDHYEKRKRKGYLFTIGDEKVLPRFPARDQQSIMGPGQYGDSDALDLLAEAGKYYNVYHIHTRETYNGSSDKTVDNWRQILGDNLYVVQSHKDIPGLIAEIVADGEADWQGAYPAEERAVQDTPGDCGVNLVDNPTSEML
jgi:hypothetical protein